MTALPAPSPPDPPADASCTADLVAECLAGRVEPLSSCEAAERGWTAAGCLLTRIPAWTATYGRVSQCFRCCMLAATASRIGHVKFWSQQLSDHYIGTKHGVDDRESVLLGHNSELRFADIGAIYSTTTLQQPERALRGKRALVSLQGGSPSRVTLQHSQLWETLNAAGRRRDSLTIFSMGDEDLPPPSDLPRLSETSIRAWFVNHPAIAHPKLRAYPRGLQQTFRWAEALREHGHKQLERERPELLMCGCVSAGSHPERPAKLATLRANGFACAHDCGAYVDVMLSSRFVASPRGNGPQNHRDFEALLAGAIPLVDYDPRLAPLWEGLPVVQVRDWKEVTPAYLRRVWADMQTREYDLAKAYFPHWLGTLIGERSRTN